MAIFWSKAKKRSPLNVFESSQLLGKRRMACQHELYDLVEDPYEMHNLVDDPNYGKVKADLRNRIVSHIERRDDRRATRLAYSLKMGF